MGLKRAKTSRKSSSKSSTKNRIESSNKASRLDELKERQRKKFKANLEKELEEGHEEVPVEEIQLSIGDNSRDESVILDKTESNDDSNDSLDDFEPAFAVHTNAFPSPVSKECLDVDGLEKFAYSSTVASDSDKTPAIAPTTTTTTNTTSSYFPKGPLHPPSPPPATPPYICLRIKRR